MTTTAASPTPTLCNRRVFEVHRIKAVVCNAYLHVLAHDVAQQHGPVHQRIGGVLRGPNGRQVEGGGEHEYEPKGPALI